MLEHLLQRKELEARSDERKSFVFLNQCNKVIGKATACVKLHRKFVQ